VSTELLAGDWHKERRSCSENLAFKTIRVALATINLNSSSGWTVEKGPEIPV